MFVLKILLRRLLARRKASSLLQARPRPDDRDAYGRQGVEKKRAAEDTGRTWELSRFW